MQQQSKIIALFILLLPFFVAAQQNEKGARLGQGKRSTGKTYALVIGVSDYAELPKLKYADKDAIEFYRYLQQTTTSQDSGSLVLLLNKSTTRDAVVTQLYLFMEILTPGDRVFVYFSGHGDMEQLIEKDKGLLLLADVSKKSYLAKSNSYLDTDLFRAFFKRCSENNVTSIFISDACRSGSLIGGEEGRRNTLQSLAQAWSKEVKLLSCQPNKLSLEGVQWGGGRGLFSYYLLMGLNGLCDKDNNNEISLFELDNFLRDKVSTSSRQTQIPATYGDPKSILGKVNASLLAAARKEAANKGEDGLGLLAAKGGDDAILALLKDTGQKRIYLSFKEKIRTNQLLVPESSSALFYYKLFEKRGGNEVVRNNMLVELMQLFQKPFDILLDYIYKDSYEKLGLDEKMDIQRKLTAALELAGNNPFIAGKIKAKLLFFEAAELSTEIESRARTSRNRKLLERGIFLLNQASKLDPLSPHIYLRRADYLLYSDAFDESIESYRKYQQLMPNNEHSYNKLGLAYYANRKYDLAIAAYKEALRLNQNYQDAKENLKVVLKKKSG